MNLRTNSLKQLLKDRGITQRQLAVLLDVTEEFLSRLFAGKVNLTSEVAFKIAKTLGIKISDVAVLEDLSEITGFCVARTDQIQKNFLDLSEKLTLLPQTIARDFADKLNKILSTAVKGGAK